MYSTNPALATATSRSKQTRLFLLTIRRHNLYQSLFSFPARILLPGILGPLRTLVAFLAEYSPLGGIELEMVNLGLGNRVLSEKGHDPVICWIVELDVGC